MKKWIRRAMSLAAAGLMALPALGEDAVEQVPVLELPELKKGTIAELSTEVDPLIGPHDGNYLFQRGQKSPYAYADPSITVNIGTGRIYDTNYMYARVKIATPGQIRMMSCEDSLAKTTKVLGSKLAARVKAVVAINGVLEADVTSGGVAFVDGPVMKQGVWMRPSAKASAQKLANWQEEEGRDTLVIDDQGDLVVLEAKPWGEIQEEILEMGDRAVNVLCFGPALVLDGIPQYGYQSRQMSSNRPAQRMAICQTGPLEYLLITSEGPDDPDGNGLKLDQFVELIASFPDVITAYNLDGGSSSTLVFRKGSEKWAKINCPKNGKKRQLRDLIYFADAWMPKGKSSLLEDAAIAGEAAK